jgi:transcription elongation GreA/GreB family factor
VSKAFTRDDGPDEASPAARSGAVRFTAAGLEHLKARGAAGASLLARAFVEPQQEPFSGAARFGAQVTVRNAEGATLRYVLVGPAEVPVWPRAAQLPVAVAVDSPIGRALLGRRAGEIAEVELPRGPTELEVLEVAEGPPRSA